VFLGATSTTTDRPDVVAAYQDPQIVRCGYGTVVTVPAPGLYDVVVFARSALTGQFSPYVRRVTAQSMSNAGPPANLSSQGLAAASRPLASAGASGLRAAARACASTA